MAIPKKKDLTIIYDDSWDKNVGKIVLYADQTKRLYYDEDFSNKVDFRDIKELYLRGCVIHMTFPIGDDAETIQTLAESGSTTIGIFVPEVLLTPIMIQAMVFNANTPPPYTAHNLIAMLPTTKEFEIFM